MIQQAAKASHLVTDFEDAQALLERGGLGVEFAIALALLGNLAEQRERTLNRRALKEYNALCKDIYPVDFELRSEGLA